MRALVLAFAAMLAFAAPSAAQYADSANAALWLRGLCPGARVVQIATTSGERVHGYCAPIELTQLRVRMGTDERVVPFAEVDSIWVRQRGSGPGATTGALVGALVVGGAGMFLSQGLCETGDGCVNDTVMFGMAGAATGGIAGAILGGIVGGATQVWRQIYP